MMYQNPMPQPPMQAMADQMAQQGRFGDSMMVHMNPIEVAGIASLSPTGQLTTNPMTGQPEAFLPFLAPLLGSLAGSTFLTGAALPGILGGGALSSAAAGAIGSGLATAAVTGDLKEGLISGLTGFGIGKALGSAAQALDPAVTEAAAKTAATEALAAETVGNVAKTGAQSLVEGGTREAAIQAAQDAASQATKDVATAQLQEQTARAAAERGLGQAFLDQPGKFAMEAGKNLLSPGVAAPIAIGEGQRAAMAAQDERDRMFGRRAADREEDLRRSRDILTTATGQVASDYGLNYGAQYAAQGGITSVDPSDFQRRYNELQMMGREPMQMRYGGDIRDIDVNRALQPVQIVARQASLRGPVKTPSELPMNYRPGFDPEISYFRSPFVTSDQTGVPTPGTPAPGTTPQIDPALMQGIGGIGKAGGTGMARSVPAEVRRAQRVLEGRAPKKGISRRRREAQKIVDAYEAGELEGDQDYFDDIIDATYGSQYATRMQEGGETEMTQQAAMRLIEQVSMALLGRLSEEESEAVINRFIDEFGSEAFQMLRSQVLESVVPNSQKEGVITGQGGGMDDQVQGMIGDSQPVAVSPGEFIVPADVVSGIGDGDTNAGVQELEGMMDRVRQERTGTTKQPAPLGAMAGGALPA
jgi:hypothetical protein|tara:strand:+ start:3378 stop:5309 length:1932 start_codon:yes stop_codon:yes gene_type:complete